MRIHRCLGFLNLLALSSVTYAQGAEANFNGPYLGMGLTNSSAKFSQSFEFDPNEVSSIPLVNHVDNSGKEKLNGYAFIGYGHVMNRYYVGGELALVLVQGKYDLTTADYSARISKTTNYSALLHLGYLISPSVLLYGIAGLTGADYHSNINFSNGKEYNDGTLTLKNIDNTSANQIGEVLGIGASTFINSNIKVKAEYKYVNYQHTMNFNLDHSRYTFDNPIGLGAVTLKNENIFSVAVSYPLNKI